MLHLERILQEQFDLMMYLPGMTFESTESLTRMERKYFINRLKRYFQEKREAENKAANAVNSNNPQNFRPNVRL